MRTVLVLSLIALAAALPPGSGSASPARAELTANAAKSCALILVLPTGPGYAMAYERIRRHRVSCSVTRRVLTWMDHQTDLHGWRCRALAITRPGRCAKGGRSFTWRSNESAS